MAIFDAFSVIGIITLNGMPKDEVHADMSESGGPGGETCVHLGRAGD